MLNHSFKAMLAQTHTGHGRFFYISTTFLPLLSFWCNLGELTFEKHTHQHLHLTAVLYVWQFLGCWPHRSSCFQLFSITAESRSRGGCTTLVLQDKRWGLSAVVKVCGNKKKNKLTLSDLSAWVYKCTRRSWRIELFFGQLRTLWHGSKEQSEPLMPADG